MGNGKGSEKGRFLGCREPKAFARGEVQMFDLMITAVFVVMVFSPCVVSVLHSEEEVAE